MGRYSTKPFKYAVMNITSTWLGQLDRWLTRSGHWSSTSSEASFLTLYDVRSRTTAASHSSSFFIEAE